jgi:hypothetical protein
VLPHRAGDRERIRTKNRPKASTPELVSETKLEIATLWRIEGRRMENAMSTTETRSSSADRLIESFHDAGNTALESVRKFLDTVNGAFPDVSADDGPRQKIIDAAFKMTEQIVGSSTKLAEKIVKVTQDVVAESDKEGK